MMAASNEDLLRDVYDTKAIFGGLLGRTFLVKPDEFRAGNSLFKVADQTESTNAIIKRLQQIAEIHGEFELTPEAEAAYDSWYLPFRDSYRDKKDKSGISGRIHTGVLKLAMILCVNYTMGLTIEAQHIEEAIVECMSLMTNYNSFVMAGGKALDSEIGSIFLTELHEATNGCLEKREFLRKHWSVVTIEQFDGLISKLVQAGMITEAMSANSSSYVMTKKCIEMLFSDKEKKK